MHVSPEEWEAYLQFIALNSALWQIEDRALGDVSDDRTILVDLLSHDLHHTIRALYVAKVVQRLRQCRIVGLVGNLHFSRGLGFLYETVEAIRVARSYGVTEFIDLEDAAPSPPTDVSGLFTPADTEAAIASIRACADIDLPDLVLGWRTPGDCRLGEYIYETVPRIARDPFLTNVRAKLEDVTREAHRIHNIIVERCRTSRVEALIAGHIYYTQWGMIADLVLRGDGKVISFDCSGNFSAFLLTRPPSGNETLSSMIRQIDKALFEYAFQKSDRPNDRFVSKMQQLFSSDYFLRPFWWQPTKSPPKSLVPLLRKIALSKLGWPDAQCPVVCVFIHCLSDLTRDDDQIYRDYYVWFFETLKIAARHTSRKWIFKTHPENRGGYDTTNATERLKAEFQDHKHIFFLDDELEKVEIFAVCDLAVTVRGSIAYEMSVFGKPTVLAGRSLFSDLGFCHVANNTDEYAALLTSEIESLALSNEMQERAKFYLIYDRVVCRIESTFMPFWTYRLTGDGNIWNALSERILYNISDLDPVAPALKAMLNGGAARTINPRYRDLIAAATGSAEALLAQPAPTPICALGDILAFGHEGNGLSYLLSKPSQIKDQGSFFAAGREAFIGFVLHHAVETAGSDPLGLQLNYCGAPGDTFLEIRVNGHAVSAAPLRGGGARVELVSLGMDFIGPEGAFVIEISHSTADRSKIGFRLDRIEIDLLYRLRRSEIRSAIEYYCTLGYFEKRFPSEPLVDEIWYLSSYPDVAEAIRKGLMKSAYDHFFDHGYIERRLPSKPVVDEIWYLSSYPDIAEAIRKGLMKSAYDHFVEAGYREGRIPSPPVTRGLLPVRLTRR